MGRFGKCCCGSSGPVEFYCQHPGFPNNSFGPLSGSFGANGGQEIQTLAPRLALPQGMDCRATITSTQIRSPAFTQHACTLSALVKRDLWSGVFAEPSFTSPYSAGVGKSIVGQIGFGHQTQVSLNIPGGSFFVFSGGSITDLIGQYRVRMQVVGNMISFTNFTVTYNTIWYGEVPGFSVTSPLTPVKFPRPNYTPGTLQNPGSDPPIYSLCWAQSVLGANQPATWSGFEWSVHP